MQVHKIELLVVDSDEVGEQEIREMIENSRYPNHCIAPQVKSCVTRNVEWSDDHPLNKAETCDEAYRELFASAGEM